MLLYVKPQHKTSSSGITFAVGSCSPAIYLMCEGGHLPSAMLSLRIKSLLSKPWNHSDDASKEVNGTKDVVAVAVEAG
jgi:hypothetical protein